MSYSYTNYVGPLAICRRSKFESETSYSFCQKCDQRMEGNFCSVCGTKITLKFAKRMITVPNTVQLCAAFEKYGLSYYDELIGFSEIVKGHEIYIPNASRGEPRVFSPSSSVFCVSLEDADPKKEIDWFSKAFEKEIQALKDCYELVELKWCHLRYYL